jgi:UDP-3-O-[3-hydroxymyristoyl] N-acetylglucosamine deacetylase
MDNLLLNNQATIAKEVKFSGRGLHSGRLIRIKLSPNDNGIIFRTDKGDISPTPLSVSSTIQNTTISNKDNHIMTIEHLMSALYSYGIDNIMITIDGNEIPIMDGSAASFVMMLNEAGITYLNKKKDIFVVKKTILIEDGDSWIKIEPANRLEIDCKVIFSNPNIKTQSFHYIHNKENYLKYLARARTFTFQKDIDTLKRMNLIKGGSLDNALVFSDFNIINNDGLRFKKEVVFHKILDVLGDIALINKEIYGKITVFKPGHKINNLLARELFLIEQSQEDHFSYFEKMASLSSE